MGPTYDLPIPFDLLIPPEGTASTGLESRVGERCLSRETIKAQDSLCRNDTRNEAC